MTPTSSPFNPPSYLPPSWQPPAYQPPPSIQFQNPFPPSSTSGPPFGRPNPTPFPGAPSIASQLPPRGYTPPSFGANPLVGRAEPFNHSSIAPRFSTPQNFSTPPAFRNHEIRPPAALSSPFQPSFSLPPNSFAFHTPSLPQYSFQMPTINLPSQPFPPLVGRVDLFSPPIGPASATVPVRDFRLTFSPSELSGNPWMPLPHLPGLQGRTSFPMDVALPFSSNRQRTTSLGKEITTSLSHMSQSSMLPATFSRPKQGNDSLQRDFEGAMRELYIMSTPPELPLSMRGWAPPVAVQVDSRTTLFIDPLTFNDFLHRATPQQKRGVHAQLANLIQPREQARIHSTALATLGNTSSHTTDLSLTTSRTQSQPLSISDFSLGFAKGLPKGMYHSGRSTVALASDLVAHPIRTATQMKEAIQVFSNLARSGQWQAIGEALSPEAHQLITRWDNLSSYTRGELTGYVIGKHGADILTPAALVKGVKGAQKLASISKGIRVAEQILLLEPALKLNTSTAIKQIFQTNRSTLAFGKELGFSTREMMHLQQAGQLESALAHSFENIVRKPAMRQSFELFDKAQKFLKPYTGFMSETQCKVLIHKTGIRTFPRPNGVPENFLVRITDKGAGLHYVHPQHNHTSIRVMPGKPHSSFTHQQSPYVIHRKNGQALDKFGSVVDASTPEAHIPIEQFIFKD
jgi:hypothetical protein